MICHSTIQSALNPYSIGIVLQVEPSGNNVALAGQTTKVLVEDGQIKHIDVRPFNLAWRITAK